MLKRILTTACCFGLVFLLSSCDRPAENPVSANRSNSEADFGSAELLLPGLNALAKSAGPVTVFDLTISGLEMEPIQRTWRLTTNPQTVQIGGIPAGSARLFEGQLRGDSGDISHKGSAVSDIRAGQTASVRLVLKAMGSARIEVLIENPGPVPEPGPKGCYEIGGDIHGNPLVGQFEFLSNRGSHFYGNHKVKGEIVGKFDGQMLKGQDFEMFFSSKPAGGNFQVKGVFARDHQGFKALAYSIKDTTIIAGPVHGHQAPCMSVEKVKPEPTCQLQEIPYDPSPTLDPGGKYQAYHYCAGLGLAMQGYSPVDPLPHFASLQVKCCKTNENGKIGAFGGPGSCKSRTDWEAIPEATCAAGTSWLFVYGNCTQGDGSQGFSHGWYTCN